MSSSFQSRWAQVRAGRVRILWLVLGALLMVSALPIGLYHRQVLQLSQDKLVDTERVQQTDLTRALAQEIQLFESNLTQQLTSERQILMLTGLIDNVEDPASEPKVTRLLENFVESNRSTFIYLTAVGKSGKGTSASQGNFRAEQDPFVAKALRRAFETCQQPQVPPGREPGISAGKDDRTYGWVCFVSCDGMHDLLRHGAMPSISNFRAVQGDHGDFIVACCQNELGHLILVLSVSRTKSRS